MSNTFFQGGKKFFKGFRPVRPPGYGPGRDLSRMCDEVETIAVNVKVTANIL